MKTVALVGRDREARILREAIDDPACAAVLLRGPAGSGKTALARAALDQLAASGALVGAGKFAEGEVQSPFAPLIGALSGAAGNAFDRLSDPEPVAAALSDALGPALDILVQSGFRLGADPFAVPRAEPFARLSLGRREGAARIIDAALRLLRWLGAFEAPVILFIDDWRRGGDETQSFVAACVSEIVIPGLTLVLAERDEATPSSLASSPELRLIEVGALAPADRRALLETLLGEAGKTVFDWLGPECPGLPFDLAATAAALRGAGAVERHGRSWRVDPAAAADIGGHDVARVLVGGMRESSPEARDLALAAALWGDTAPAGPLAHALGMTPGHFHAALAELRGLGVMRSEGNDVGFPHDRLRAAVLEGKSGRAARLAGVMAERLVDGAVAWAEVGRTALRLRRAAGIEGVEAARWRDRFAQGSAAARAASDMDAAAGFAECAWLLRDTRSGADGTAQRLVAREAVLAAADRRDPAEVRARLSVLFVLAGNDTDAEGRDYELAIAAFRLAGDPASAWSIAQQGLARFGLVLPRTVGLPRLLAALALWRLDRLLQAFRGQESPQHPAEADAFTRVANAAAMLAYERSARLSALLALEGSRRAGRAGRGTPFWMSAETFLLASLGDWAGAARLGDLTAAAVAAPGFSGFARASTLNRALGWGCAWRTPAGELRGRAAEVRGLAMAEGDLVQAAGAIRNWVLSGWRSADSLTALEAEVRQARDELERLGDADVAAGVQSVFAAITHLIRPADGAAEAPAADDPDGRPSWTRDLSAGAAAVTLELASTHGEWAFARDFAGARQAFRRNLGSSPRAIDWRFHETLARLKTGRRPRRGDLAAVRRAARLNPLDHQGKLLVLEAAALDPRGAAEKARRAAWASAVDAAEAGASRLVAGVAAECARDAARGWGDPRLANHYAARARAIWRARGALAKLDPPRGEGADESLARELADAQAHASTAERTARARARFLADVAHELRTPLQSLQGLLDLAADDPAALDLVALRGVSISLRSVVDDLTDLGALTSGEAPVLLRPVDIADLVRSECALAAPSAAENGAALLVAVDDAVPAWVETDGPRVRQVVRNLVSNAGKYGRGGRIRVHLAATGARLGLSVADEGPGLGRAELLRLFEPFERGARAGDGLGLGLGLALSRRIAHRLGGALVAENRPEGGARFILSLPLIACTPVIAVPAASVRPLRILLAEDVGLVRRLFAAILSRQGHQVIEAADGGDAARRLGEGRFDLAIVDLAMPVMGGLEVLERLQGQAARIPAILLTASTDAETSERARAAGAALVLRKPVSAEELSRAVAALGGAEEPRPGLEAGMDALRREAGIELGGRIARFVESADTRLADRAAEAHRIAGLAAQFGWPGIAALADDLEAAYRSGRSPDSVALARLQEAATSAGTDAGPAGAVPAEPQPSAADGPSR